MSAPNELTQLITEMAKNMTPIVYQCGQVLFYEGHMPCGLFVIKEGKVELSNRVSLNDFDFPALGFQNLLSQTPYGATCTATTVVKAVFLAKTVVQDIIKK